MRTFAAVAIVQDTLISSTLTLFQHNLRWLYAFSSLRVCYVAISALLTLAIGQQDLFILTGVSFAESLVDWPREGCAFLAGTVFCHNHLGTTIWLETAHFGPDSLVFRASLTGTIICNCSTWARFSCAGQTITNCLRLLRTCRAATIVAKHQ